MTQTLTVSTATHQYPIVIADNCDMGKAVLPYINGRQVLIVSNTTVAPLYLEQLQNSLTTGSEQLQNDSLANKSSLQVATCILPDGEEFKTQSYINKIYDELMNHHFNRDVTLIALGGGVVGDMTGFAAASFMRGVNFIQIPTTLLAQVDSSVGGKTGINHPKGKNMIGAFWQPQMVLANMQTLKTLPIRELSAGMAEVIKYALIMDVDFLSWLEAHMLRMMDFDKTLIAEAVARCCQYKADIVAQDERESGVRALLNFGHTFGHVIETHEGYGQWLHGEAVAVGMVQAATLSQKMGWISDLDVTRIKDLLKLAKLPVVGPNIDKDVALNLMQHDKKVKSGQLRLILLKSLGEAVVTAKFDRLDLESVLQS